MMIAHVVAVRNIRSVVENSMKKEFFEREIAICQELCKKNGSKCSWGSCDNCGVIPLLYKLYKGELYEKESEIESLKRKILK